MGQWVSISGTVVPGKCTLLPLDVLANSDLEMAAIYMLASAARRVGIGSSKDTDQVVAEIIVGYTKWS